MRAIEPFESSFVGGLSEILEKNVSREGRVSVPMESPTIHLSAVRRLKPNLLERGLLLLIQYISFKYLLVLFYLLNRIYSELPNIAAFKKCTQRFN